MTDNGSCYNAFEPEGVPLAMLLYDGIEWRDDAYSTMAGADAAAE